MWCDAVVLAAAEVSSVLTGWHSFTANTGELLLGHATLSQIRFVALYITLTGWLPHAGKTEK